MLIEISQMKLSIQGSPILDDVHMQVREGEIYGLLGPNGAGKSTTLSVLTGLRTADSGRVCVLGLNPAQRGAELRAKIGVLAEDSGFYGWMSAQHYLHWMARLYGRELPPVDIAQRLHQVGLAVSNRQRVGTFSRGMKQRLGLARALIHDPQLLILDEPTNGLDPRGRREIHDLLIGLSVGRGIGILLCTHLLDDVDRLCSRIGIMHEGRTMLEGGLPALLADAGGARYRLRLGSARPAAVETLPHGTKLIAQEGVWLHLDVAPDVSPDAVWAALFAAHWHIVEIHREGGGLEALYLSATDTREAA